MSDHSPNLPIAKPLEGWESRFIGSEPRLSEVADMYRELGFEVRIEEFDAALCDSCCKPCFEDAPVKAKVIYTRKNSEESSEYFA